MEKKEANCYHQHLLPCPPLAVFPDAPVDQPGCEMMECPGCKNKMWASSKKRRMFLSSPEKALLLCYFCMQNKLEAIISPGDEVHLINI